MFYSAQVSSLPLATECEAVYGLATFRIIRSAMYRDWSVWERVQSKSITTYKPITLHFEKLMNIMSCMGLCYFSFFYGA